MPRPFCIAGGHTLQARHEEAEALLRPTLPPLRAIYGEHPTVASVLERLGNSLIALGRRDERLGYLRESLAIRVKVLGERHSDVQRARVFLGRALSDAGQYVEAESLFVAALRARTEVFGPQHGAVASSTDDLGALAFTRGDYPEAVRRYRAAIAVWQAARLPQWEMSSQSSLGEALMYADSLGESERVLREALTHQRTIHGADHAEVLLTADRLASTLRRRGGASLAEADSLFRTTLAIRRRLFGSTSSNGLLVNFSRHLEWMTPPRSAPERYLTGVRVTRADVTHRNNRRLNSAKPRHARPSRGENPGLAVSSEAVRNQLSPATDTRVPEGPKRQIPPGA